MKLKYLTFTSHEGLKQEGKTYLDAAETHTSLRLQGLWFCLFLCLFIREFHSVKFGQMNYAKF